MDQNTMMMLGVVKLKNPVTQQVEIVEVRGFDILGLLFPFLRYAVAGMWGQATITFLVCCTFIGYPVMAWLTAFSFKKNRF